MTPKVEKLNYMSVYIYQFACIAACGGSLSSKCYIFSSIMIELNYLIRVKFISQSDVIIKDVRKSSES